MLKDKFLIIKKYINKHLNKGFIYPSISLAIVLIFLAKKLKKGIQFCVDYKGLNAITIKN